MMFSKKLSLLLGAKNCLLYQVDLSKEGRIADANSREERRVKNSNLNRWRNAVEEGNAPCKSLHVFSPEVPFHFRVPLLTFKFISVVVCHFNRK